MSTCPDCKGSGEYVGFSSRELCQGCAGSGVAGDADRPKEDYPEGFIASVSVRGRLLSGEAPVPLWDPKPDPNAQGEVAELKRQLRDARVIAIAAVSRPHAKRLSTEWRIGLMDADLEYSDAFGRQTSPCIPPGPENHTMTWVRGEQPKWIPVHEHE